MGYECKILRDSVSARGQRLTTFLVTFPRFILAEVNTHRMLSRNSASSRAIPVAKSIAAVQEDPFVPEAFGRNQKGMQAAEILTDVDAAAAAHVWNQAKDDAIRAAEAFVELDVHKALGNRVLETYKWHTALLTATDWSNFFALRTDQDAQPEFREIALMMREAREQSEAQPLEADQWHLPFIDDEEFQEFPEYDHWKPVSVGRCARTSYETHFGFRDPQMDIALTMGRLLPSGHLSPFEHVARPWDDDEWRLVNHLKSQLDDDWGSAYRLIEYLDRHLEYDGNLHGWHSMRRDIIDEHDWSLSAVRT